MVEKEIVDDTMTDNKNKSIKNNTREWEEDSDHNEDDDAIISVSKDCPSISSHSPKQQSTNEHIVLIHANFNLTIGST